MGLVRKLRCKICKAKIKKDNFGTLVLQTAEGEHEIKVCRTCSDFFNESAEVIQKQGFIKEDDKDESI